MRHPSAGCLVRRQWAKRRRRHRHHRTGGATTTLVGRLCGLRRGSAGVDDSGSGRYVQLCVWRRRAVRHRRTFQHRREISHADRMDQPDFHLRDQPLSGRPVDLDRRRRRWPRHYPRQLVCSGRIANTGRQLYMLGSGQRRRVHRSVHDLAGPSGRRGDFDGREPERRAVDRGQRPRRQLRFRWRDVHH